MTKSKGEMVSALVLVLLSALDLPALAASPAAGKKEIFAFYITETNETWQHFDWNITTTVAVFGIPPVGLVTMAHSHGAKVVRGIDYPKNQLTNATARSEYVANTVSDITSQNLDGVNFDIEGNTANRDALTSLVKEMRNAFTNASVGGRAYQISFATAIYPKVCCVS